MGKRWAAALQSSPRVECAAVIDANPATARAAVEELELEDCVVAASLAETADSGIEMVVNATIPAAHRTVTLEALQSGVPVLSEKPIAPTVAEGMTLAAAAEAYETLLMVSQSRRYFDAVSALSENLHRIGDLGLVSHEFFKAPHFGGFREEMDHVLLVDMAIHPFDLARFFIGGQPVAVYCEDFNPSWSWYSGAAAAHAVFEFSTGVRFGYSGSWCSPGNETSWNGEWRISGSEGSIQWDGEASPVLAVPGAEPEVLSPSAPQAEQIEGALEDFLDALRTGEVPFGEAHRNISSLAMVEAAVLSSQARSRLQMGDVLGDALSRARAQESDSNVQAVLDSWNSGWDAVWP